MYPHDLRRLRVAVTDGEPIAADDTRALLDEVDALRKRIGMPTELHVTARVDVDQPDRLVIDHPLLMSAVHASDPADALVLAAIELRRGLAQLGANDDDRSYVARRVEREQWAVLAARGGEVGDALAAAIEALETAENERDEQRAELNDVRVLRPMSTRTAAEQDQARRRQQARSLDRLAAANVRGVARAWSHDGFGSFADHGRSLPALVVATRTTADARHLQHRFDGDREWIAVEHRATDGFHDEHATFVATVVEPTREAERGLQRLSLLLPQRADTIAHLASYREVIAGEFQGTVRVDRQRGDVGGGCWPIDLESVGALTADAVTVALLDDWARPVEPARAFWSLGPHWELLWLADAPRDAW